MTESEAIKICNTIGFATSFSNPKGVPLNTTKEELTEAMRMSINEIEKQIPKKIEIRKATNDDIESELRDFITVKGRICRCPSCRCCIHISELKYCWECGQKLDWRDEE